MTVPRAFVSYSWDDESHKDWVATLATHLRRDGIDTTLDQWHAVPGDQLTAFMEREIRENDYVLIICTPNYRMKSDERRGGVGYEGAIMTAEIFTSGNHRKFIPVLAQGTWGEAAPVVGEGEVIRRSDHPGQIREELPEPCLHDAWHAIGRPATGEAIRASLHGTPRKVAPGRARKRRSRAPTTMVFPRHGHDR